jgi:hypothetical protein
VESGLCRLATWCVADLDYVQLTKAEGRWPQPLSSIHSLCRCHKHDRKSTHADAARKRLHGGSPEDRVEAETAACRLAE